MPDLSGGQKFSFPTLFDFYREVFLIVKTKHKETIELVSKSMQSCNNYLSITLEDLN